MRVCRLVALTAGGISLSSTMVLADTSRSCLDALLVKYGDAAKIAADPSYPACRAKILGKASSAQPATNQQSPPATPAKPAAAIESSPIKHQFLLRQDFSDVWIFSQPLGTDEATGATFSYSTDSISHNTNWSLHGMAALVLSYTSNTSLRDYFSLIGFSVAPYVAVNRLVNSNSSFSSSNTDIVSAGGTAEVGFKWDRSQHYFRIRGASVDDRIAHTSTGSTVFEWIPIYQPLLIGTPTRDLFGLPIVVRFNPEFTARYDALTISDASMTKRYYWRYGPEAAFVYQVEQTERVPEPLRHLSGATSLAWLHADDGRDYPWLETSLTYNIDEAKHFGLTASYQTGRLQDTGAKTNIFTVGLSAKW